MLEQAQYVSIGILCLAALFDSFSYSLLLNELPSYVDESDSLHYSGVEAISPGSAYSLALFTFVCGTTIFPLFAGKWSDELGRRPLLIGCLCVLFITNLLQVCNTSFWVFVTLRFFTGASGCLRPLAITYIADLVPEEKSRGKLISCLSLLSAFSVGFGPLIGARLVESDRSNPFRFMAIGCGLCLILTYFWVPEVAVGTNHMNQSPGKGRYRDDLSSISMKLVFLGFSTYFMSMMATIAFPLSLKDSFGLSPFFGSLCSIVDGPVIFVSNFIFMQYLTSIPSACTASVSASLMFCLIYFVPLSTEKNLLFLFLLLKYSTSVAAPIVFSAIPHIMINICPRNVCGHFTGLLSFFHGAGRLTATALVGPLFAWNAKIVYDSVAVIGLISACVFALLYKDLMAKVKGDDCDLTIPLIKVPLVRQLSMVYPGTPTAETFPPPISD